MNVTLTFKNGSQNRGLKAQHPSPYIRMSKIQNQSDSDEDQPNLLRVDSRMSKLERRLSVNTKAEDFQWEDSDDKYDHSRFSKCLPIITLLIVPCVLIPYFVGRGISSIDLFDNSKNPVLEANDSSNGDLNSNGIVISQELMRWGIWLTVVYSLFVASWIVLHYVPFVLYRLYISFTRFKSEKFKDIFEYLRGLRRFLISLAVAIGSNIVFEILWFPNSRSDSQRQAPNYIFIIGYLLKVFVFYAIFRLGEACLMLLLFVHLKNKTFRERINDSKHALGIIEHLEVELDKNNAWKSTHGRLKTESSKLFSWITSGKVGEVDITSTINAKRLAKKLFTSLSKNGTDILPTDFYPYFEDVELAMEAFYLFDTDRNGDISKKEMKWALTSIYDERRFILSSFNDINDVVKKLDSILFIVVCIITVIYGFTVFGQNVLAAAVPLLSGSLALSFMFAETARQFFSSLMFLFGMHPMDTGDIICIKDVYYRVSEMSLMYSILQRLDGTEVYISNAILCNEYIHNIRRSPAQSETVTLGLDTATTLTQIDQLQSDLIAYLKSKPRDFRGTTTVDIKGFDSVGIQSNKSVMTVIIGVPYKRNFTDMGLKGKLRNEFMRELKRCMENSKITLGIQ